MAHDRRRVPRAAAAWELDGLARLARSRDIADAVVVGHWPADADVVAAAADLTRSAAVRLEWADACRRGQPS